jgi:hypothetical protein
MCARQKARRYSIEDMQELANQRGGKCLSTEFITSRANLKWRCEEGHEWEGRADGIIYSGKWCPVCGRRRVSKAQTRFEF